MTNIPIPHSTEGLPKAIRQEKEAKAFLTKGTKSGQIFRDSTERNAAAHVESSRGAAITANHSLSRATEYAILKRQAVS